MSATALSAFAPRSTRAASWGRFALIGLATVVAAVLANVAVYFLGDALIGYDPDFLILQTVEPTISMTAMLAVVAVGLYAALLRFTRRPARIFAIVSAVLLVLSIVPDFTYIPTVEGSTNGQVAVLVLQHIVAAAVIVWMLTALARPRSR
jgi:hypothetical protein